MAVFTRLVAAAAAVAWTAVAKGAALTGVAVAANGADVAVTLTFDGGFEPPSLFAMDAPARLVVDLPGATTVARAVEGEGTVSKVRTAQFDQASSRVVVDLSAPMTMKAATSAPGEVRLLLTPADAKTFAAAVRRGRSSIPATVLPGGGLVASVAAALEERTPAVAARAPAKQPPAVKVAPADSIKPMSRLVTRSRDGKLLVVVDPGHGGHDIGAPSVVEGKREKDVVLAIGRAVARELEASGKVRVLLTRGDDRFIPLPQRVVIARAAKASLFISIHADSAPSTGATGASIYTLSDRASDAVAARLAARENKSDIIGGVNFGETPDVADILIDLTQRETRNASSTFAQMLQKEMSDEKVPFKGEFHRFAALAVLKAPDVPSVLLETGYLSNEEDTARLFSDEGQRAIARGVRRAVEAFLLRPR